MEKWFVLDAEAGEEEDLSLIIVSPFVLLLLPNIVSTSVVRVCTAARYLRVCAVALGML